MKLSDFSVIYGWNESLFGWNTRLSDEACLYQQLLGSSLWQDAQNSTLVSKCSLEHVIRSAAAVNKLFTMHFHVVIIKVKFSEKSIICRCNWQTVGFLSCLGSSVQTLKLHTVLHFA